MNDYTDFRAYFIEKLNKLAHESGNVLAGLHDDISRPLTFEEKMDVRRLLNEYASTAYMLDLIESKEKAARNDKKSFLKKLFKRKN